MCEEKDTKLPYKYGLFCHSMLVIEKYFTVTFLPQVSGNI